MSLCACFSGKFGVKTRSPSMSGPLSRIAGHATTELCSTERIFSAASPASIPTSAPSAKTHRIVPMIWLMMSFMWAAIPVSPMWITRLPIESRSGSIRPESPGVPSGEDHQRPLRGGFPAPQHGRLEIVGAGIADHARDLARRFGRDGRHVDVRFSRGQGAEEAAAFGGDDVAHGDGVGDHRDRDFGAADEVRERRRGVRPRGDQRSHLRRRPVVHRDVVALRQEVPAHRLAHDPQPDKTDLRHRSHLPRGSDPPAKFPP